MLKYVTITTAQALYTAIGMGVLADVVAVAVLVVALLVLREARR